MPLSPEEIIACVTLPTATVFLGGLIWYWRRSSQGKVCREWFGERRVGAKKQEKHLRQKWPYNPPLCREEVDIQWEHWLNPRCAASVEDAEEGQVSYTADLPRGQPFRSDDVPRHQAQPSRPLSTYQPRSLESGSIPLNQFTPTRYLHIIVFTSPKITRLSDIQVPELPNVVFTLSINPTLKEVDRGLLKDIDWERCQRGSISEFRIIEESGGVRDDADGIIDATPGHERNALARPLHAVPEDFSIKSELKVLAGKIMEQEGYSRR